MSSQLMTTNSGSQTLSVPRTLELAGTALTKIDALRLGAIPPNYEIWYTYYSGTNPALNRDIDDLISSKSSINQDELDRVCLAHLSTMRVDDRLQRIGTEFGGQLREIADVLDDALGNTTKYSGGLSKVASLLDTSSYEVHLVRNALRALVELTMDMQRSGAELRARLDRSKQDIATLQSVIDAARAENQTDGLTGVANRKSFERALTTEMCSAVSAGEPLCLLLLDIDHFKAFNDRFGHSTGDQVLKFVAHVARQNTKGKDIVARIGGEEFAVLLPHTTLQRAIGVAEQIRKAVMAAELKKKSTGERLGKITLSTGAATVRDTDTLESFVERTDQYLYAAKRAGRNRIWGGDGDLGRVLTPV
jgi:diguanylate cyclase